jgi:hypothetical protein
MSYQLEFTVSLIKPTYPLFFQIKIKVSVELENLTFCGRRLHSLYINVAPETPGTFLALSADDASPYSTDRKQGFLRKQVTRPHVRGVVTLKLLKRQPVRSCRVIRPVKAFVSLKERYISFVNRMKYFDVIAEREPAWRILIQMTSRVLRKIC